MLLFILNKMIHPDQQLNLAKKYFDTLPSSNLSKKYSETTRPITFGLWSRIKMLFNIDGYYQQLTKFYPYHNIVLTSAELYQEEVATAIKTGLAISAASVFAIYQFARRGKVLPVLRKYGKYANTHRVFRQYVWAWVLPTTLLWTLIDFKHIDNVEQLWKVHARRMQNHVFEDPEGTQYPKQLHELNSNSSWLNENHLIQDIKVKLRNEIPLSESQSYENPEYEAVDFGEDEVEQADEE